MLSGEEPSDLPLSLQTIPEKLKEGSDPVSFKKFLGGSRLAG